MRLIPYDVHKLKGGYKRTRNYEVLKEFADSDLDCAKLVEFTQASAHICANSLNKSALRFKMYNINVNTNKEKYILSKL